MHPMQPPPAGVMPLGERVVYAADNFLLARPAQPARKQKFGAHFAPADASAFNVPPSPSSQQLFKHARTSSSSVALAQPMGSLDDDEAPQHLHASAREGAMDDSVSFNAPGAYSSLLHAHPSQPIRLNVGGMLFDTTLQTLFSQPSTYFHGRFGGKFDETASAFDGSFFIDRDGTHFRHVLNWMRDLQLLVSDYDHLLQLMLEADFYGVDSLLAAVKARVAEIRLERIRFDEKPTAAAPAAPSAVSGVTHAFPMASRAAPLSCHRNLFMSNWSGPQWVGLPNLHTNNVAPHSSAPFAIASSSQPLPSHRLPTRTHSCPNNAHFGPAAAASDSHAHAAPQTQAQASAQQATHAAADHENENLHPASAPGDSSVPFEFTTDADF